MTSKQNSLTDKRWNLKLQAVFPLTWIQQQVHCHLVKPERNRDWKDVNYWCTNQNTDIRELAEIKSAASTSTQVSVYVIQVIFSKRRCLEKMTWITSLFHIFVISLFYFIISAKLHCNTYFNALWVTTSLSWGANEWMNGQQESGEGGLIMYDSVGRKPIGGNDNIVI